VEEKQVVVIEFYQNHLILAFLASDVFFKAVDRNNLQKVSSNEFNGDPKVESSSLSQYAF
jgi:hypothetical protein